MKLLKYILAIIPLLSVCVAAQTQHDLDFWIGEWKVKWTDQAGKIQTGTNTITKSLSGKVIEENFRGAPGSPLVGHSVSVYNEKKKLWYQTWVDNQGSYMLFEGGKEDDRFVLRMQNNTGPEFRMVFKDIKDDSLTWDWMKSDDGGKTWKTAWLLKYTRIK